MTCLIECVQGQEASLVTVAGGLDLAQAPELAAALPRAIEFDDDVVADLRGVGLIDCCALRTLMRAVDRLSELAGGWRIAPRALQRATQAPRGLAIT